jgi:hypothetical protein
MNLNRFDRLRLSIHRDRTRALSGNDVAAQNDRIIAGKLPEQTFSASRSLFANIPAISRIFLLWSSALSMLCLRSHATARPVPLERDSESRILIELGVGGIFHNLGVHISRGARVLANLLVHDHNVACLNFGDFAAVESG